jgi:hypothetical protein
VSGHRTRQWSVGTGVLCVLLVVAAWFLLIAPRRSEESGIRAQQAATEQANQILMARVEQLRAQFAELPKTQAELAQLRLQLTPTEDMPALVRTITALATASGADLKSITPGSAVPVTGTGSTGTGTTGTGTTGTGAKTAGTTTAGAGAAAAATSGAAAGQTARAAGAAASSGLVSIPLAIAISADYYQAVGVVRKLQTEMARTLLITGLQIDQDTSVGTDRVRMSITGQVFALPDLLAAATVAASPSISPAPPVSPSSSAAASPAVTSPAATSPAVTAPAVSTPAATGTR